MLAPHAGLALAVRKWRRKDTLGRETEWEFEIGEDKPVPASAPAAGTSTPALGAPSPTKKNMSESASNVRPKAGIATAIHLISLDVVRLRSCASARLSGPR